MCFDADNDSLDDDNPENRDNYCQTRQFLDHLVETGWVLGETVWYEHVPNAPHNEAAWARRYVSLELLRRSGPTP